MIVAVDFDGTLFENIIDGIVPDSDQPLPIGEPIRLTIEFMKALRLKGHKVMLFTCREGIHLSEAVNRCSAEGLTFDSVNESVKEIPFKSRKPYADYYLDDRSVGSAMPVIKRLNAQLQNDVFRIRRFLVTIEPERLLEWN